MIIWRLRARAEMLGVAGGTLAQRLRGWNHVVTASLIPYVYSRVSRCRAQVRRALDRGRPLETSAKSAVPHNGHFGLGVSEWLT